MLIELAVHSEGSISWFEAWEMSFAQRTEAVKVINKANQMKSGTDVPEEL